MPPFAQPDPVPISFEDEKEFDIHKKSTSKPMSVEESIMQMELLRTIIFFVL